MLPDHYIQTVLDTADIYSVIGRYVQLKKQGASYAGISPFSNEKTPSFFVNPSKGIFKDFSSGKGGSVITFLMEKEALSFPEAVLYLGDMYNIERPKEDPEQEKKNAQRKTALQVLQQAQSIYLQEWAELPNDHWAKQDIEKRKFPDGTSIEWQIGYAPSGRTLCQNLAPVVGLNPLIASGLATEKKSEKGDTYHTDFFYNRLLIPIHNATGQLVGFGGRSEADQKPKYLNPRDSEVYNKSNILFGLDKARKAIQDKGYAILTEGYFDVIAMHSRGMTNTVASCGTGFAQGKLLRKYASRAVILYDGDTAGMKAIHGAIQEMLSNMIAPEVCILPDAMDPCDFCATQDEDEAIEAYITENREDAIKWKVRQWTDDAGESTIKRAYAVEKFLDLLLYFKSKNTQELYISDICKEVKWMSKTSLMKELAAKLKEKESYSENTIELETMLPEWVDTNQLATLGFVQNSEKRSKYPVGVFFLDGSSLQNVTNFIIKPLFHIPDERNNRRLVEVNNGVKHSYIEMPSRAFVSLDAFETALVEKGNFMTNEHFKKNHFKRLIGTISEEMPIAHEITSLGWQPEGFFAWANRAFHDNQLLDFDDIGIVEIEEQNFFSPGVSKIYQDQRSADNIYENDLYLSYRTSKIDFAQWAKQFRRVYSDNAPLGIAFVFISLFKDIVVKTGKCPLLYGYGPKGSGKSDFAESITWLFFSGLDAEQKLIRAYNLNPGQGTPFSFFSRLERFTNCPALFNEFDENNIEDFKFGAFKASYDGEGREVGDGESGKRRRTKIQKVKGTVIIVGQFMSIKDDGSVLSRSLTCEFFESNVKALTDEDKEEWQKLKDWEQGGLSQIIIELMQYRDHFSRNFKKRYWEVVSQMQADFKEMRMNVEQRILRNYALAYSVLDVMADKVKLPFTTSEFYEYCRKIIIQHNSKLKENNLLASFWNTVEYLFTKDIVKTDYDLRVAYAARVSVKVDGQVVTKDFAAPKNILYLRMQTVYPAFAKSQRETGKKVIHTEDTIRNYMKDQSYYIGLCPGVSFRDSSTSAIAIDLDELGMTFFKEEASSAPSLDFPTPSQPVSQQEDLPF